MESRDRDGGALPTILLVGVLCAMAIIALGLLLRLAQAKADASNWPVRPVRAVVPFPAGSATDVMRPLTR